jgi:hypothetical protein
MIATRQGGPAPCNIVCHKSVFSGSRRALAAPLTETLSALALFRLQRQM